MLEFYSQFERKARKDHLCSLCRGTIGMGEKYIRYSGRYSGDYFDDKYHLTCQAVINEYCGRNGNNEYDDEEINYWLESEVCCNLCDIETRDDCFNSAMRCPKVLKYLEIKTEETENADKRASDR